ncbi:hypothetical protein A7E75_00175 [Syntrophotalea acetylenica]|uniref:ABC transporter domain-containing protein n=1 Tax=Syntrophotalea acetylenica TaxID=29542 RepID=A0A1L3GKA9_SYNAC|nr:hypothetical protein A7E75_00175 [Syntrophotalea acetylenica]
MRLENITRVRLRQDGSSVHILRDVCLEIAAGDAVVLIGPSGSGKTTLLRLVNRLEDPTAGRILLDGMDIASMNPVQLRQRVALVPQKTTMFQGSVLDNLRAPFLLRKQQPPPLRDPLWREVLDLAQLSGEFLDRPAGSLSLGQQQRVGLARALVGRPAMLLLDEPTSALDRPACDGLARSLRSLCRTRGVTLLLASHDLWFVPRVADQAVFLNDGKIEEQGPAGDLFNNPRSAALRRFLVHSDAGGDLP